MRNSILHAGPGARTTVSLSITGDGVRTTVTDHGTGFSPDDVPPHRLGWRSACWAGAHTARWIRRSDHRAGRGHQGRPALDRVCVRFPGVRRDDTVSTGSRPSRRPPHSCRAMSAICSV